MYAAPNEYRDKLPEGSEILWFDNREGWLDGRAKLMEQGLVGASDVPAVMGLDPYRTAQDVWAEATGTRDPEDLSDNLDVQMGSYMEPFIEGCIREWVEYLPEKLMDPGDFTIITSRRNNLFTTLDRFFYEDELIVPVEMKFSRARNWLTGNEIHPRWEYQLRAQMLVTGSFKGWLAVLLHCTRPSLEMRFCERVPLLEGNIKKSLSQFSRAVLSKECPV